MSRAGIDITPRLEEQLRRLRIAGALSRRPRRHGERRSSAQGQGVEFAERRPYQPGDDLRRLDHHAYVREGRLFVREYAMTQAMETALLLDVTRSMSGGRPRKIDLAKTVAFGLGYVALAAGDGFTLGLAGAAVEWSRRMQGRGHLPALRERLADVDADDGIDAWPPAWSADAGPKPPPDVLFVVTDLMYENVADLVRACLAIGDAVHVLHVVDPLEGRSEVPVGGLVELVDAETGGSVWRRVNRRTRAALASAHETWAREAARTVTSLGAAYHAVKTDATPAEVFLEQFRVDGLLE